MASYDDDRRVYEKLRHLFSEALIEEQALRDKFGAGNQLDIIPKKLQGILQEVEDNLAKIIQLSEQQQTRSQGLAEDDTIVYVYLFNGHGKELSSWGAMMTKDALFGYSVNRPIYHEKKYIAKLLESRTPLENNGALAVVVKNTEILTQLEKAFAMDLFEQPLVKVKEGALKFDRIQYFFHKGIEYTVGERGKLTVRVVV